MAKKVNIKGLELFQHQRDVFEELRNAQGSGKVVVVCSSRQKGKTALEGQVLLHYCFNVSKQIGKPTKNFLISPTLRQARNVYNSIISGLKGAPGLIKIANSIELNLVFANDSSIRFLSAEMSAEALRGYSCNGITVYDEMAFIPAATFEVTRPFVDFAKAPILMCSTPFIKSPESVFWRYYCYGLTKEHNTVLYDWSDEKYRESIEKILSPETLAEYKKVLPERVFRQEYLGEWLDDGEGQVFQNITNCIGQPTTILPNDRLFAGIDWSNQLGEDYTVLSVFADRGGKPVQVLLKYWNNLPSPTSQIDAIYKELEPFLSQIVVTLSETNSIGSPYTTLLQERSHTLAQKIEGWTTSNSSKGTLVANFQVALEQGQIALLPDDRQKQQLQAYSCEYNPRTHNLSWNAPFGNDDICIADMLALQAFKERGTTQYAIRFAGNNRYKR